MVAAFACARAAHFVRSFFVGDVESVSIRRCLRQERRRRVRAERKLPPITSVLDPDLGAVRRSSRT